MDYDPIYLNETLLHSCIFTEANLVIKGYVDPKKFKLLEDLLHPFYEVNSIDLNKVFGKNLLIPLLVEEMDLDFSSKKRFFFLYGPSKEQIDTICDLENMKFILILNQNEEVIQSTCLNNPEKFMFYNVKMGQIENVEIANRQIFWAKETINQIRSQGLESGKLNLKKLYEFITNICSAYVYEQESNLNDILKEYSQLIQKIPIKMAELLVRMYFNINIHLNINENEKHPPIDTKKFGKFIEEFSQLQKNCPECVKSLLPILQSQEETVKIPPTLSGRPTPNEIYALLRLTAWSEIIPKNVILEWFSIFSINYIKLHEYTTSQVSFEDLFEESTIYFLQNLKEFPLDLRTDTELKVAKENIFLRLPNNLKSKFGGSKSVTQNSNKREKVKNYSEIIKQDSIVNYELINSHELDSNEITDNNSFEELYLVKDSLRYLTNCQENNYIEDIDNYIKHRDNLIRFISDGTV